MTRLPGLLKAKFIVSRHGLSIILILGIVALGSFGTAGWVYAHPSTTEVTDHTHKQEVSVSLESSAVVTGDSVLYSSEERIEHNPVYFVDSTPNLTLTGRTAVPDDQQVRVRQNLSLIIRASHNGEPFWQQSRELVDTTETTSNGSVRTTVVVDIRQLRDRIDRIRSEIGSAGTVEVLVDVQTAYRTDRYAGNISRTTPLRLSQSTYSVEELTATTTESTPQTREVAVPRDPSVYTLPAGVGVVALVSIGVVGFLYARKEQPTELEHRLHRARYSEWISEGTLPPALGHTHVPLRSLEDLVDVSIDAGTRIIYDADVDTYAVLDGNVIYCYPGGSDTAWGRDESDAPASGDE